MKPHTSVLTSRSLCSQLVLGVPLALTLAGAVSACADAEPRDLGFTQSTQDLSNEPTEPFFQDSSEFLGRWAGTAADPLALNASGSAAAYSFPSGSSRFQLDLRLENNSLVGTLTFGEGAPLPAATDPDVGYPAGVAYDALLGYEWQLRADDGTDLSHFIQTAITIPPFEGFPYQVLPMSGLGNNQDPPLLADGVLTLGFSSYEVMSGWCFLQTSYPTNSATGYSCIPSTGGGLEVGSDGTGQSCELYGEPILDGCLPDLSNIGECYTQGEVVAELNCDKVTMCVNSFCTCYDAGCEATSTDERLTLRRDGDELVGLFEKTVFENARGLSTPLGEVRLQRVQ